MGLLCVVVFELNPGLPDVIFGNFAVAIYVGGDTFNVTVKNFAFLNFGLTFQRRKLLAS